MIRLHKLYIKGFKDPDREINLTFADGAVTVIYGKNGCGKTTLLNVLNAIFRGDDSVFVKENISRIELHYTLQNETVDTKVLAIQKGIHEEYTFSSNELFRAYNNGSILFGVHRGIVSNVPQNQFFTWIDRALDIFLEKKKYNAKRWPNRNDEDFSSADAGDFKHYTNFIKKHIQNSQEEGFENIKDAHLSMDFITIKSIKNAVLNSLREGKIQTIQKTANAFFEVIEAFEKQMSNNFDLMPDTEKRVKNQMNFIQNAISQQPNSSLKEKLEKYITTFDSAALDTKISRAVLLGVLDKAETLSPELYAVKELQTLFNAHLSYGKKLEVTDTEVFIDLGKGRRHELDELSSGERNLLTMLTLFLIIGSGRNFLMIDEPENSLHLDWQSDFIQLVEKMNPQAQIIVATHSPAIATNTKSLVELI